MTTTKPSYWDDANRGPDGRFPPAWSDDASLQMVAQAIVHNGHHIEHQEVPDLRALIEAVQSTPGARLATLDTAGKPAGVVEITRAENSESIIEQPAGNGTGPTNISIFGGEVASCCLSAMTVRCALVVSAHFPTDSVLGNAKYLASVNLGRSYFTGTAAFGGATFYDRASFIFADFIELAAMHSVCFCEDALFGGARFSQDAGFQESRFVKNAILKDTHFTQSVSFEQASFEANAFFLGATIDDAIDFTEATINQRLILGGERMQSASLAPGARLRIDNLIARAGASIELDVKQHLKRPGALILGEDSDDPEQVAIAAADYNRLRDFFRAQPSTDEHEEECNFKCHDLRRRARYLAKRAKHKKRIKKILDVSGAAANRGMTGRVHALESALLATRLKLQWERASCFFDWALKRNALGYLIRWQRIVYSGACIVLAFALLYRLGASADTLAQIANGEIATLSFWGAIYFSALTFATVSFGDLQPLGWLRIATAVEALLGVAWMALFIVSWARKLVR